MYLLALSACGFGFRLVIDDKVQLANPDSPKPMKPHRFIRLTASLLLLAGAAGAQTVVFNPGVLRHQVWSSSNPNGEQNASRPDIEAGIAGVPSSDTFDLTHFDTIPNVADNYGERVS